MNKPQGVSPLMNEEVVRELLGQLKDPFYVKTDLSAAPTIHVLLLHSSM